MDGKRKFVKRGKRSVCAFRDVRDQTSKSIGRRERIVDRGEGKEERRNELSFTRRMKTS